MYSSDQRLTTHRTSLHLGPHERLALRLREGAQILFRAGKFLSTDHWPNSSSLSFCSGAQSSRERKVSAFYWFRRSGSHLSPSWCGMHTWRCLLSGSSNPYNNASWHLVPSEALQAVCSDRRCIVSMDQCSCDVVDLFIVTLIFNPLILLLTAEQRVYRILRLLKSFKLAGNVMKL